MATVMEWGVNDCLTDFFGDDAHQKILWLKKDHDETVGWILTLSELDRLKLFRDTFKGQGYYSVDKAEPGDAAIGNFRLLGLGKDFELAKPWIAQMGFDCHWYIRIPSGIRVVDYDGSIEILRCPH